MRPYFNQEPRHSISSVPSSTPYNPSVPPPTMISLMALGFLFCVPPIGFLIMWRYTAWPQTTKWVITFFVAIYVLAGIHSFLYAPCTGVLIPAAQKSACPVNAPSNDSSDNDSDTDVGGD